MTSVEAVIQWFRETPNYLFEDTDVSKLEVIQKLLSRNGADSDIKQMSKFICKSISLSPSSAIKWQKRLYIFDGNVCKIVFIKGRCYIDEYGNYYASQDDYLFVMRQFYGYTNVKIVQNNNHLDDRELAPRDYMRKRCFKTLFNCMGSENNLAIKYFEDDCISNKHEALNALRNMKIWFYFFNTLKKLPKEIRIYFFVSNDTVTLIFPNLTQYRIKVTTFMDDFDNFKSFIENLDLKKISALCDFKDILRNITTSFGISFNVDQFNKHINDEKINQRFTTNIIFKNCCYHIAHKILEGLKEYCNNASVFLKFTLPMLKYVVLWVACKYRNETDAILSFANHEDDEKEEFYRLIMAIIKSAKSAAHLFANDYTAAYHFGVHYAPIRLKLHHCQTLSGILANFPELTGGNEITCAPFYLQHLPDFIFCGDYLKQIGFQGSDKNCQNYSFTRHEIRGIQYKFVETAVDGPGNTEDNPVGIAHGTTISTIHEVNNF